jgi:anti-sigma B factor antagonist
MFVSVEHHGVHDNRVAVITLDGNLDAVTAPRLTECLSEQHAQGYKQLVVDFSGVGYISSAGLRAILAALKEARQSGGDVRLASVQPSVHKVFEMGGFTTILEFYADIGEAVKSFSERR